MDGLWGTFCRSLQNVPSLTLLKLLLLFFILPLWLSFPLSPSLSSVSLSLFDHFLISLFLFFFTSHFPDTEGFLFPYVYFSLAEASLLSFTGKPLMASRRYLWTRQCSYISHCLTIFNTQFLRRFLLFTDYLHCRHLTNLLSKCFWYSKLTISKAFT